MEHTNRLSLWKIIKKFIAIATTGFLVMWGLFWYLSGSPMGLFRFLFTYYAASHYFMEAPSKDQLFEGSLKGMISSLGEPHSQYLDKDEFKSMMQQTEATYSGVGIVLGKRDNKVEVVSAIDDQPAAKAGIVTGDTIVAIDGIETSTLTLEETSRMVRGEAGTEVMLRINHQGEVKDISIKREKITLPTVKGQILDDKETGYIRISQFADKTGADFAATYQELKEKGMKRLVLDLRNNPGGLVTAAQDVGNYILPAGPIVSIQTRTGKSEVYESKGLGDNLPLVVLINKGSASASEIIAGAVQDEKVGTIVGTTSYGKGTVQTVIGNFDSEAIKLTIAKYHTPNDRVIDKIGIVPDVEVKMDEPSTSMMTDVQLQKALEILRSL